MAIGLLFFGAWLTSHGAAGQDSFPDTPANHWVYEAVADLQSEGVLVGYPDGIGRGIRPSARYEMAVAVNAACVRFHDIVGQLKEANTRIAQGGLSTRQSHQILLPIGRFDARRQKGLERTSKNLIPLVRRFSRELTALGVEVQGYQSRARADRAVVVSFRWARPGEALTLFPDVPSGHWAAQAIQNLHADWILRGYPEGKFGG